MSRLSLLGLLAIASCSFDLSRSDAALADRGLDGGLPDRRLSDQAREPSPPIADRGDAETLPRITWYSSGKCAVGRLVGGGSSCGTGGSLEVAGPMPSTLADQWQTKCGGGVAASMIACSPLPTQVVAAPTTSSPATCGAATLIGGGCDCGAGQLRRSYPQGDAWQCECSVAGTARAICLPLGNTVAVTPKEATIGPSGEVSCAKPSHLVGGSCEATSGGFIKASMPTASNDGWSCAFTGTGGIVRALCAKL